MTTKSRFAWEERLERIEEIAENKFTGAKNLGTGEGIPQYWTLCDIGPENAYLELTRGVVKKADKGDLVGFWKGVCSLITQENLKYVFRDTRAYNDFLIRGALLYCGRQERYSVLMIQENLMRVSRKLEAMLLDQAYNVSEQLGDGYIVLDEVIKILEKDFLRIQSRVERYYVASLQNHLRTLLRPPQEIPTEPNEMVRIRKDQEKSKRGYLSLSEDNRHDIEKEVKYLKEELFPSLTPRQQKIWQGIEKGQTQKQIADDLEISDRTVRNEIKRITEKYREHRKQT